MHRASGVAFGHADKRWVRADMQNSPCHQLPDRNTLCSDSFDVAISVFKSAVTSIPLFDFKVCEGSSFQGIGFFDFRVPQKTHSRENVFVTFGNLAIDWCDIRQSCYRLRKSCTSRCDRKKIQCMYVCVSCVYVCVSPPIDVNDSFISWFCSLSAHRMTLQNCDSGFCSLSAPWLSYSAPYHETRHEHSSFTIFRAH